MSPEFTAQMSERSGRWCLYVILRGSVGEWPQRLFTKDGPVPTFTQRADTLAALGFEAVPGALWEWIEDSQDPDDPASPVVLIAAVRVRSRTGALA